MSLRGGGKEELLDSFFQKTAEIHLIEDDKKERIVSLATPPKPPHPQVSFLKKQ